MKEQSCMERFLVPILPSAVIVGCSAIPSGVISSSLTFGKIVGRIGIMKFWSVSLS